MFVLTDESQQRLSRAQAYFAQIRAGGGSLTITVNMRGLLDASKHVPDDARLSTWLRTSQREGFLKIWSGNYADARKHLLPAKAPESAKPVQR